MTAALIHAEFGKDCDLYAVMGVTRSATEKEITRAYHKLALKYHPDKQRGNEASCIEAKGKFQAVSAIHSILSNKDARAVYDESGTIVSDDQDVKSASFHMWTQYFARIFPKVSKEDIKTFEKQYRHSEEERHDVMSAYTKYKGEMPKILDTIMLSTDDDEARFAEMIQEAIEIEEIKLFPTWRKYVKEQSKPKKTKKSLAVQKESKQSQTRREELDSTALSTERKCEFESLLGSLEARFTKKGKQSKRKAVCRTRASPVKKSSVPPRSG
ncbi:unnamed protein product [Peronospora belbahrii]|uniref:J domain-containing protein n=1 Tax=Peronospora belbahrii TaxID=622444 RepID=A0AAU9KPF4_9STRA|nr:unnamed protein product [Peronospora belbahrii]